MSNKNKTNQDINILLKSFDEIKEQKERIESKFRDLTHAYKSLLAEKKALEITVQALKTKKPLPNSNAATSELSASSSTVSDSDHESTSSKTGVESQEAGSDANKIAALTSNIQVLLDTKSKMEASYQAEKKKLRIDLDDVKAKYDTIKNESDKISENYETKLKELRVSLKQSQTEREKLNQDLNDMIKLKSSEQESKIMLMNDENQTILFNLRNENIELKSKVKNLNKQFDNKCEQVIQCEYEIKKLKKINEDQIKRDELNLNDLRQQLKELTDSSQRRILDLESNISQLCSTIATYENNNNLNHLNSSLSLKRSFSNITPTNNEESKPIFLDFSNQQQPTDIDIDSACEQITQLKKFIEKKAKELNIDFNLNDIWSQNNSFNVQLEKDKQKEMQTQLDNLKDENKHLREEYEKYKIRTNYLIKSAKQASSGKESQLSLEIEIKRLKNEVDNLKMRLIVCEREKVEELEKLTSANQNKIIELRNEFKQQLDKLESNRLKSLNDLEKELVKQRERTFKLLAEKEAELEKFKFNSNNSKDDSAESSSSNTTTSDYYLPTNNSTAINADSNMMDHQSSLIYYSQENAYKENELNKLRQAKINLEYKLKQTIDENAVDADRYQNQINILKQEIERLKLNSSRTELNGSNLEYIKNVVFNYMTTKDNNIRLNLTNSLVQILHFTKSEKQKLQSQNSFYKSPV